MGEWDFVALKDFPGFINAIMLAFLQHLGDDLLSWGGGIPGCKWWQQQPPDLLGQLVVMKSLLDFVQEASKSIVTSTILVSLIPFCSKLGELLLLYY